MSTSAASSSNQNFAGNTTLDSRLVNLYSNFRNLPENLPDHPEAYPFAEKFALDDNDLPRSLRPTVRFADLTPAAQLLTPDYSSVESEDPAENAYSSTGSRDNLGEPILVGSRHFFEVEQEHGVFLASKYLSEALSDHLNISQKPTRPLESTPCPEPARKRQRVDVDSIVF
ncbi:unnamed protein product [Rhizoctonia solani]|uniref:Uncharacterized protein n=1 Tax=Rhizoctonia solani TaxID=456999 RepID=A0A8H3GV87_9AGAM|nr:unnamed protein product [Rhizoctonia solani]